MRFEFAMSYYDDGAGFPTLQAALDATNADELKKLVVLTGEKPPGRKGEMAAVIRRFLAGEHLQKVWLRLNDLQRAAVAETVHSGSTQFNGKAFRAKYDSDPDWEFLRLFFYRGFLPDDLCARLQGFVPEPSEAAVAVTESLPESIDGIPLRVHETERAAQRELVSVLRLVDAGKMAVSDKTRRPSAAAIEGVSAVLENGDFYPRLPAEDQWSAENAGPIRAFAWPMLIQAGGMAQLSGTRLQLTKAGRNALAEPPAKTIHTLWKKWQDTTLLDELARIECVKGQSGKGKRGLTAVSSRRQEIVWALADCPPGKWIAVGSLIRHLDATGGEFSVTRNAWGLYVEDPQYGSFGYEGHAPVLDRGYLLAFLLEYAATLGIIDVALVPPANAKSYYGDVWGTDSLPYFSRYDGLQYFRLTALGAYCLDVETAYEAPPVEIKQVLRVTPDLGIETAESGLDAADRLALEAYATPVSDGAWRLDPGKLLAAIEAGRTLEEVRDFLETRSGEALPDGVTRLLDETAERTSVLHDCGLARLVECADAGLAETIAKDPKTGKHCMRAGDRHLVVTASAEAAFRRGLREAGYLIAEGKTRKAKAKKAAPDPPPPSAA